MRDKNIMRFHNEIKHNDNIKQKKLTKANWEKYNNNKTLSLRNVKKQE